MTGLDAEREEIMSIACFITDAQLKLRDEQGWEAIIHHERARLDKMDEWCTRTHGDSGLMEACISSNTSPGEAALGLLSYIQRHVPEKGRGLLAGNSVHCDRTFLSKTPYNQVTNYLSYRILDVSTIKEAVKRWAADEVIEGVPPKQMLHQAKADILESIEEARYYREKCFMK